MSAPATLSSDYSPKQAVQHRRHVHYSGRVQGVGFRYTVKNIAMRFNVGGYVRNLPDGRVELVMEGPAGEIEQMMNAVHDRMNDYIRNIQTAEVPPTAEFAYFQIRH